ncbi:hypothetical protein [Roseovarius ramblicola]|uniref:Lipoprotein n=1 Tax=Roseovarius ramblicola TaxID=2022336 RepID=A0ABV5HVK5_9RHOB
MVGSSKILTVSYGTFSCTLEGFDESFETMKAIAEYFRDLAADDRYFGAEPPTPDADMLARIAEREVARRVEAHEDGGRIVLRAQDNAAAGRALASALGAAPETAFAAASGETDGHTAGPGPVPRAGAGPGPAAETETVSGPETAPDPAPEANDDPESVTAAESDAMPDTGDVAGAPATAVSDVTTAAGDAAVTLDALEPEGLEREEDALAPDAATGEDAASSPLQQADEPATLAAAATPAAEGDALSARLDLIRSVVGTSDSYDEDEHAQNLTDTGRGEPIAWDMAGEDEDDDAALAGDAATTATGAGEDTVTAPADADDEDWTATGDSDSARAVQEDNLFEDTLAALLADATPVGARTPNPDEDDGAERGGAVPPETGARPGARVFKVRRADVETAHADGLLDTADAPGEDTVNIFGDETAGLSPEDEADLQRELASLDAELGDKIGPDKIGPEEAAAIEDAPGDIADSLATEPEPEQDPTAARPDTGKRTEVSRIFDETDSQMADPGSVRRRNTIQHLRAALAATRAEKAAGSDLGEKVDTTPYRSDLDAAVRPRRAISAPDAPRSARPEEPRPAPLKLVAEQRVDDGPRSKVRPRRVTTPSQTGVIEAQNKDFSAFADELGATGLPDLLEAAAAYLADVEGRSQFSRPMLMGKLREVDEDGFSREDGLRSFGQLLREGKLQKLSGGRFCVTEETEFRSAAQRRAG